MNEAARKTLLPAGLRDVLPPDAAWEADVVHRLGAMFRGYGYERVKAPLIEFEDTLLSGSGAALSKDTFRVMDPISQKMMGVRADMTGQMARIAASRLARAPRPLRLCYAGQVLRVKGTQLRPERQFTQAGLELIGSDSPAADAEVAALTAQSLERLGIEDVALDVNLPSLAVVLCDAFGATLEARTALRRALDRKDEAGVQKLAPALLSEAAAATFTATMRCAGPAKTALERLEELALPADAKTQCRRLHEVLALIRRLAPSLAITVDPLENRGFSYHIGIGFSVFSPRARGELARGGRYLAGERESAVGASVDVDAALDALNPPPPVRRLFLALEDWGKAPMLQNEGWTTIVGLEPFADSISEALRLGCSHCFHQGEAVAVSLKKD